MRGRRRAARRGGRPGSAARQARRGAGMAPLGTGCRHRHRTAQSATGPHDAVAESQNRLGDSTLKAGTNLSAFEAPA
ncbi:unnamed protein product [Coccothraustes coccothraustes]